MITTLTFNEQEIKQAMIEYAKKHHGIDITENAKFSYIIEVTSDEESLEKITSSDEDIETDNVELEISVRGIEIELE